MQLEDKNFEEQAF